ncbi:archaeal proteasome endopeptidase complex subunit beta [Candidatus Micrarchaeota archaeon]|nr:archaeal proteasome endopeptidase complex subunit beta [Candidatus Micrarchaeota archaeon]
MEKMKTGTTTLGIVCDEGVVLASDKRATMGYLVSSKTTIKVAKLDRNIGMTIAGGVGDAQKLIRWMRSELEVYRLREGEGMTVKGAATLLANVLSNYKFYPFFVQLIVGGYDSKPELYSLDMAGGVTKDDYISTGSGSPFVYGLLETGYDKKMSLKDCLKLAAKCIIAASKRDIASGNGITMATITKDGFKYLTAEEIEKIGKEVSKK